MKPSSEYGEKCRVTEWGQNGTDWYLDTLAPSEKYEYEDLHD